MTQGQPKKPIKILYVITQGEMGGAQQYVFDLATNLPSEFDPEVAMGIENTSLGKKLEASKVKVHYLTNLVRNIQPIKDLIVIKDIKKLINQIKPNIIHLNSSKAGIVGSVAVSKAKNVNVIFTAHGFAFLEPKLWITRFIYYLAEKYASKFRKKIITITNVDRRIAIKNKVVSPDRLVTIFNGIHVFDTLPREEARKKLKLNSEDIVIGTIAHDYKTKDLPTLKKAVKILQLQNPNIKLVIIGRGSEYGEIKNAKKLLSAFDIYASTSTKEGHPYSLLEAASAALPIVATNVGGIPDTLEHNKSALLVEPSDPKLFAAALNKILNNQDLGNELAKNAKTRADEFTLDKMLKQTVQLYKDCF